MDNQVTFTTLVKEEICAYEEDDSSLLAFLSGFIKVNGNLSLSTRGMRISLNTENPKVARKVFTSIKKEFNIVPSSSYSRKMKLNKAIIYGISIEENVMEILEKLQLMNDGMPSFPKDLIEGENLRHFLSGAFLASGSVNSPSGKNYHLQFVVSSQEDAAFFLKQLNRFHNERNMDFKIIERGSKYVLYLKKSDQIGTFLSLIYAHQCYLDFENSRIEKDYLNSMNRVEICYNANFKKSLEKGEAQIKEIDYIIAHGGEVLFTDKEKKLMKLRKENPEASLSALSELLTDEGMETSKSGVNHIFSKIHDKYEDLKKDE